MEYRRLAGFAITSGDIGCKALGANLSDLAAMAAQPAWATLALTLPRADEGWIADFARGFFDLAEAHGVALIGGDLTRGPLTITVGVSGFAGIDLSDGLAADLGHLLKQSGCGATVYPERLPLSPALHAVDDLDRRRALALAGGDDYELCFTVPPAQRPMLESRWRGAPMTSIGRIDASPGLRWICADGSASHPPREGYRHF